MRFKFLFIFFLLISFVLSQNLQKLFTQKQDGNFFQILNLRGSKTRITKNYKGGIFLKTAKGYKPVHKRQRAGWVPKIKQAKNQQLAYVQVPPR